MSNFYRTVEILIPFKLRLAGQAKANVLCLGEASPTVLVSAPQTPVVEKRLAHIFHPTVLFINMGD